MVKKIKKYAKFIVCVALIMGLIAPSYAALSASDGSAFVTKAEFDSALADFNARLTTFEAGINSKIDSQVTSYLDRNGIWNGKQQVSLVQKDYLQGTAGLLFSWTPWGDEHPTKNGTTWPWHGTNYSNTAMVIPWVTKFKSSITINAALDEVTKSSNGGPNPDYITSDLSLPTLIPWINQAYLGPQSVTTEGFTQAGIHIEQWISSDRPLFVANKSGLAFCYLTFGSMDAALEYNYTLQQVLTGQSASNGRNAFALGHLYPWSKNNKWSGGATNKLLTQRTSFFIDFIDRTTNPTPATAASGVESFESRYPWFSDSLVPYDSMYFTANEDRPEFPLGKPAGYLNSFNVPTNRIITQFFVQKGHKYVLRVASNHDTPFGNTFNWDAIGLFYAAWAFPTSYYDFECDVY